VEGAAGLVNADGASEADEYAIDSDEKGSVRTVVLSHFHATTPVGLRASFKRRSSASKTGTMN
jgi:hypothetical protein